MIEIKWQDWELNVIKMRAEEKKTYAEIIEFLRPQFPELTETQLNNKIANLIKKFNKIQNDKLNGKSQTEQKTTDKKPTQKKQDTVQVTLENEKVTKPTEDAVNISGALAEGEMARKKITYDAKRGETIFEGIIALLQGEPITPEKIMQAHNLSPEEWQVVSFTSNSWQAQTKDSGKMALWQSKITVRPAKEQAISLDYIEKYFAELATKYKPTYTPITRKAALQSGRMLEINISDLHYAKLAWAGECGENYDYKIAQKRFDQIINAECRRLENEDFEKILFVWTNDFFNSDTPDNNTTAGTPQSTDLRWPKMFETGVGSLVDAITKLSEFAPLKTFYIASNHCRQTEFYATMCLKAYFKDKPKIQVDTDAKARHFELYGNNLIGFSHSSFEKKPNLKHLMAIEVPNLWSKAKYREMHLAHYHCEKTEEIGGVIYRWLPSVTGPDQWHYDSGYIGAYPRSYSFTWRKEGGLESINSVNIDPPKRKVKTCQTFCEK